MSLEINFDCRSYKQDKTPDLRAGAHFFLTDGCLVDLSESPPEQLSNVQKESLRLAKDDTRRKRKLCYLPIHVIDACFGPKSDFDAICPTCGTTYTITRQQYQDAFDRFVRGEQK